MDRCPNCRARIADADTCRRCGLDLAPLLAVERAAAARTRGAVERLARGEARAALADLLRARALKSDPLLDVLIAFARAQAQGS